MISLPRNSDVLLCDGSALFSNRTLRRNIRRLREDCKCLQALDFQCCDRSYRTDQGWWTTCERATVIFREISNPGEELSFVTVVSARDARAHASRCPLADSERALQALLDSIFSNQVRDQTVRSMC